MIRYENWPTANIEKIVRNDSMLRVYKTRSKTVDEAFRKTADRFPHREAMVDQNTRLSYDLFQERVDRFASGLARKLDVARGDRVAFMMGNHSRWAVSFLGIARAGAISVPLNNRLQAPEIVHQLNNSQSRYLIVDPEFLERIGPIRSQVDTLEKIVVNSPETHGRDLSLFELEDSSATDLKVSCDEDDVCTILYTSGTTGLPKGAMLTHQNVISIAMCLAEMLQYSEKDRMLFFIPLFHVTGLVGMFLPMIINGGANVVLSGFRRHEIPEIIENERITATMGVPAIFILLMQSPNFKKFSRASMKSILYGGAPSPPEMHEQLLSSLPSDCILVEGYGLTECSSNVTISPVERNRRVLHKIGTIGVPNPLADLRVVDDAGNDVSTNEIGELLVRDPGVMKGYWNEPEKTAEAIKDGWLCTGDLVSIDEDGYLLIKGRRKHMINRGGENIYPIEIENVLYSHPDILEAAVLGIPDKVMGEEVKAVIVLKDRRSISKSGIQEFMKPRLADYKIPRFISFVDELPRNPGGKVIIKDLIDA